jgi:hypothetical protein
VADADSEFSVHHNELTEKYLAAFEASGIKASEFRAAVRHCFCLL